MQMAVRSKFHSLHAQKEMKEGRRISYREIARKTGLAESTVLRFAKDAVTLYSANTLTQLCEYFNCEIGDLLEYDPEEQVA